MDYPAYSVLDYSEDTLIAFLCEKTQSINRKDIDDKLQLQYLFKQLNKDRMNAQTLVIEHEYIDKHYLEDYAEYYVRCFEKHSKTCSRVHFFSSKLQKPDFNKALNGNSVEFEKALNQLYLGYIVIRPIPSTFMAKTCIKPYPSLSSDSLQYKIIKRQNKVSLFGLNLEISSTPLLEQDKVVAACATSAIWSLLSASNHINENYLPSLSSITKAAEATLDNGTRIFPSEGLTPIQTAQSLKHYGLEASIESFNSNQSFENTLTEIKERIYAYSNNDVPVLLGGTIYTTDDEPKSLGKHLICVLGYTLDDKAQTAYKKDLLLKAHYIKRIYAHDDQHGPYSPITLKQDTLKNHEDNVNGIYINYADGSQRFFVPDLLIIGIYHKVRITYTQASYLCRQFHSLLDMQVKHTSNNYIQGTRKIDDIRMEIYASYLRNPWQIELITNNKLKAELLEESLWNSSHLGIQKSDFLSANMPRYMWRVSIANAEGERLTEFHLDATQVPQGKILIGYIAYTDDANQFWSAINEDIQTSHWAKFIEYMNSDQKTAINSIQRFFTGPTGDTSLNTLYGPIEYPNRDLKNGEKDINNNIRKRPDLFTISRDNHWHDLIPLDNKTKYIWVINRYGDLVLGEDIEDSDANGQKKYQGHPTLIDGEPARIAGELFCPSDSDQWQINSKSRTYSSHLQNMTLEANGYLKNIIQHHFGGQCIVIQPNDAPES